MIWLFYACLAYLAFRVFRRFFPKKQTSHGSASWLKVYQAARNGLLSRKGLFVGDWSRRMYLPIRYKGAGHCLTVGSTGSSKGIGALIPNALAARFLFLVDPGGETTSVCIKEWRKRGYRVYVLNPWGMHKEAPWKLPSHAFNPLDYLDPASPTFASDAAAMAETFIPRSAHEQDPFWNDMAVNWIKAMLMHIKTAEPAERQDPLTLREYVMGDDAGWQKLIAAMKLNKADPAIGRQANEWERMIGLESRVFDGVLSAISRATALFDDQVVRESVRGAVLRIEDQKGFDENGKPLKGVIISLVMPLPYIETHSALTRLLLGCAFKTMMTGALARHRVLYLIDECAALGRMGLFERIGFPAGRKYRMWLWLIFQNIGQIKSLYGDNWHTFEGNSGLRQYIAVNDPETADHVSRLLGTQTVEAISRDSQGRTSVNVAARKLLMPEEVRQVHDIEQIVFIGNQQPIKARIRPYWEQPSLRGRFFRNPYHGRTPGLPLSWSLQVITGRVVKIFSYAAVAAPVVLGLAALGFVLILLA